MSSPTPPAAQALTLEQAFNKALALHQQGDLSGAERLYRAILAKAPQHADCLHLLGVIHHQLWREEEALVYINRALQINPQMAAAYSNKGLVLHRLMRLNEAIASYSQAITLAPGFVDALYNRANAYKDKQSFALACADYEQILKLDPGSSYCLGTLLYTRASMCDWRSQHLLPQLAQQVAASTRASLPFTLLTLLDDPYLQLACARIYIADRYPPRPALWRGEIYRHQRIRIAYLSADFHDHATAYLMAELFELHDHASFEIHVFSFGVDKSGAMRQRLSNAVTRFYDVNAASDAQIATMLRQQEIDIAIDLKGFTQHSRSAIFSYRAAPVQVNYLGYPGTMGAPYIDYIIADRHIIPAEDDCYYQEKVVRLPDSYQVNDSKRVIADDTPSRAELGLPANGFVFCSFNNHYKITPDVFAVWMRLLQQVSGSVLWLLGSNPEAEANLRLAAQEHGVDPVRLVFAARTSLPGHLARHRQADLFVDTVPVNAHTGASDALWAGLPVLTVTGRAFAGRVAGSLLKAIGLPELICTNLEEYERLALELATDHAKLAQLKAKLAANKRQAPLFDTLRFCKHLETAYRTMYERQHNGLAPASMTIEQIR